MAEQNPIRYQDLILPDDSIEKLIGQLEQLQTAYSGMAESVRSQAAQVAASLRSVSGATEQGRSATRNASQEADRLAKAYRDLEFAQSDTAKRIQELKNLRNEENRMTKLQIQLNRSAEGSYNQLSAQYSLNKMAINNLTKAERENDPAAKKLIEDTKAIYEEMKRMQEATGKFQLNVGNYEGAINNAIGANSRWFTSIQQLGALFEGGFASGVKLAGQTVVGFGKQLLALLANPVVATIAAITAAFMALAKGISSSEENTNALMRILAPFERILTGVVSVLQTAAEWILKGVEGFEKLAMGASRLAEKLPIVGSKIRDVNNALAENIELTRRKQILEQAERSNSVEQARLESEVARIRNEAAKTNDAWKKEFLLSNAIALENRIMLNEIRLAKEDLAIKQARAEQAKNDKKANDELAQARVRLYNANTRFYQGTMRMESQLASLRKKNESSGGGGGGKATVDTSAVDAANRQLEEQRKIEDARIALEEDALKRERMMIITSYDRKIEDAKRQYGEETELAVLYEQEKQMKLADLVEKGAQKELDERKKAADRQQKAVEDAKRRQEQAVREGEERIAKQYDLDMSYAELEKNENDKTRMRLEAEKKRMEALLALYEKDGEKLTDVEVQTIRNSIALVNQELQKNKGKKDLWDVLGFKLDNDQKEAINQSLEFAKESLSQFMQAYVDAANEKRQLADEEIDRTRSVLEAEIEARANGYANEVETARKEYENAKKQQRKAIEEQRRAQQAQEAIDTASQVSSLITATANIWKAMTGTGPWGIALAIASTALMWGSFAASKVKAHEMAGNGTESYGEGTVQLLEGGSHQSGNDIDLGRKPDGTRRRAEGGEFFAVINKRNSRRYRSVIPDVINSLNEGTFAEKYMNAYDGGAISVQAVQHGQDLTRLSDDVHSIREQGERNTYVDGHGRTVMIYKNVRRIISN
jgi:hypothetical protein